MLRVMVMVRTFLYASFILLLMIAFGQAKGQGLGVRVRVGLGVKSRDNTKIRPDKRQDENRLEQTKTRPDARQYPIFTRPAVASFSLHKATRHNIRKVDILTGENSIMRFETRDKRQRQKTKTCQSSVLVAATLLLVCGVVSGKADSRQ